MRIAMGFHRAIAGAAWTLAYLVLSSHAARCQEIKFADLEGTTVATEITFDQMIRRDAMKFATKLTQVWKISPGENKAVDFTMDSTARGAFGTRKAKQLVGSFELDESRSVANRGGGDVLWTFADGTLTFVRTLPSGAYRMHIAFAHGPDGPTCTVTGAFARENGTGPIQLISPFNGDRITILSAKQVASSCKVGRK